MDRSRIESIDLLDNIIIGRVEPHIYAFKTNTIPNYLKVGDTYRPVSQRLNEWKKYFPELEKKYENKAIINDETYFRDYSVHQFLENDLKRQRLLPIDINDETYYSKEFFKNTEVKDIDDAIEDIKLNYKKNSNKYDYYSSANNLPQIYHYKRGDAWELRPNQRKVVDQFINAINNGRKNLLMYAVMRFGKSFTSLCCALEINAKLVLVVSAKADVREEWKKTVESAGNFKEYEFLDSNDLSRDENAIDNVFLENKKVILFLTLQDLQGKDIKEKHRQVLSKQIDLLIVDETHFGARAESFGKILKNAGYNLKDEKNINNLNDDAVDVEAADEEIKKINAKIRLHLSGTPYRILMGSEFEKEDIISFVQFSDIVKEQEKWDEENLHKDDTNEWDNPYYGFPQMVRFAFNPNKSSRKKMEKLKESGVNFAFSKLFEPRSIALDKKDNFHKLFINQKEILDLLQVIDGSKEDDNLLGFLDYAKIKEGKMCRHMVMVLPYCASCDAMEELIKNNKDIFKNLNTYEIINISGLEAPKIYKSPNDIKNKIKEFENKNKKTLTLTVNRMLTGSTVEQWDTMLYLKDTASPQEYDQSIFRLQNQYIRTLSSENGIIKENLKPQTLLVDFDPNRLFKMQEQKSLIYNVNTEKNGNSKLRERIEEEIRISPIITMNHNKIKEVTATNILEYISEYNNQRSVSDEVLDIPVDLSLLNDEEIRKTIESQGEFNSKQGLTIPPNEGEGDELEIETPDLGDDNPRDRKGKNKDYAETKTDKEIQKLESKIKTYYQRILFFSFLTKDEVSSLDDILDVIESTDNERLAKNLLIDKHILEKVSQFMDPFKRSRLDYKIQSISMLANDKTISPIDRAMTSIKRFNRMSESEIVTPAKVCVDMINLIPEEELKKIVKNNEKFLDFGCKSGEYAVAIYNRLRSELCFSHNKVKDLIYAIPTSSIAYEFTRKFYEILDLNVDNIASNFNAYDLLEIKNKDDNMNYEKIKNILEQDKNFSNIKLNEEIKAGDKKVKFGAVVGNPPYQLTIKKATKGNNAMTRDIYNKFKNLSLSLSTSSVLLYPAKEYQRGSKKLNDNNLKYLRIYNGSNKNGEKNIPNEPSIFGDSVRRIPGDVGVFYWEKNYNSNYIEYQNMKIEKTDKILPVRREFINLAYKLKENAGTFKIRKIRKACESSFVENNPEYVLGEVKNRKNKSPKGYSKVLTNNIAGSGGKAHWFYIKTDKLDFIQPSVYKVVIGSAYPNESLKNLKNIEILDKNEMFGRTKISIYSSESIDDVKNFILFLNTSFGKTVTHMTPLKVFYYMPDFDKLKNFIDWTKPINEIDEQLFEKYNLTDEERNHIKNSVKDM